MISHDGRKRNLLDHGRDRRKPRIPLRMILAVIDEIAHVDKKACIGVALPCSLRDVSPDRIIARLRIGEDQRLEAITLRRRRQRPPLARLLAVHQPVLVGLARRQSLKLRYMQHRRAPIVREILVRRRRALHRLRVLFAPLDRRHALRRLRLPHDRARNGRIARDDLTDELRLDSLRIRNLIEPLRRPSEDIKPLRQKSPARQDRRPAHKLEEGAAVELMIVCHVVPLETSISF